MIKKLKKRVRKSTLFFLALAFMANSFAWFIYSNKVSGSITTGVKSWKINFKQDGADLTNNIEFKVDSIYPGMKDYSSSVSITNVGELTANINYELTYVRVFDEVYDNGSYSSSELLDILNSKYPFKFDFSIENPAVGTGQTTSFNFVLSWAYESGDDALDTVYGKKSASWKDSSSDKAQVEVKALVTASQKS